MMLSLCAHGCTCVHLSTRTCMHVCIYTCMCTCVRVCIYTFMCTCICVHVHIKCVCACIMAVFVHVYVYVVPLFFPSPPYSCGEKECTPHCLSLQYSGKLTFSQLYLRWSNRLYFLDFCGEGEKGNFISTHVCLSCILCVCICGSSG